MTQHTDTPVRQKKRITSRFTREDFVAFALFLTLIIGGAAVIVGTTYRAADTAAAGNTFPAPMVGYAIPTKDGQRDVDLVLCDNIDSNDTTPGGDPNPVTLVTHWGEIPGHPSVLVATGLSGYATDSVVIDSSDGGVARVMPTSAIYERLWESPQAPFLVGTDLHSGGDDDPNECVLTESPGQAPHRVCMNTLPNGALTTTSVSADTRQTMCELASEGAREVGIAP